MCLPPDVSTPALPPIGRRRDVNPSAWSTDPRAHPNWGAPPPQAAGPGWPSWVEFFNMPQPGFAREDACGSNVIEAAPLGSLLASALVQQEVSKTWQPQPNWAAAPQSNSFYCSPQPMHSSYAGDALLQSAQGSQSDMVLAASSKPMMTAGQETLSSITPRGVESLERPKEEDKSQAGSLFDELYQEGRVEQDPAKNFCGSMTKIAKTACHKSNKQGTRPAVKKESTSPKDVCMVESDLEGSDDDGEGAPVISEKRRKRMLSNRASAQRSRQRRQERLDTLEVLVAQLRVENAALKSKASSAAASVKKLEDENRVLRERLDAKEQNRECQVSLLKDVADNDNHSFQTTGNSNLSSVGNSHDGVKTRAGDSDSSSEENSDPNKQRDVELSTANITNIMNTANSSFRVNQQASKKKRSCEDALEKEWSFNPNYSTVFGTENVESVGNSTSKMKLKSTPRVGLMTDFAQEYESMKSLASLPQFTGFTQEMDAFDLDLEHSPDIDKKLLDSVEEIWLDGFSDVCFK